ncbi:MAG: type I 3-dehydroquinate dehydratase [Acidobacteriota bacterium]
MKLCLTLAEPDLPELERKMAAYAGQVPFIETRLDYLNTLSIPELPAGAGTEFIATCRPERQGGRFSGPEQTRIEVLRSAVDRGFQWVDLELDAQGDEGLAGSSGVVRSCHSFGPLPADLSALLERLRRRGGEVFKLALSVSNTRELVRLLQWMETLAPDPPHVVLAMGALGQPARYLGALLGNSWTYVAEHEKRAAASGQFGLHDARLCFPEKPSQEVPIVYGVIGHPVQHSLSPPLHNGLFRHHRVNGVYFPFALDDLDAWFSYVSKSRLRFNGFSVTLPFKTAVLRFLKRMHSPVQAVNTLTREESGWAGFNTDLEGFLAPLKSRCSLKGKRAVVIGNGGVAHTVVAALRKEGVQLTVVGRDGEKVDRFARLYGCPHALLSDLPIRAHLLVNATPVGQYPNVQRSPLAEGQLDFDLVYDLVYHPQETLLLKMAKRRGAETLSGIEMFAEQAARQFHLWTGIHPSPQLIKKLIGRSLEAECAP